MQQDPPSFNMNPSRLSDLISAAESGIRPMVLIASLPKNDPALAQAALDNGADAVKVHIDLHHHASGTHFGPLDEERASIEQIYKMWAGRPCGIVPGATANIQQSVMDALPGLGVNFISLYMRHARVGSLPPVEKVDRMLALNFEDGVEIVEVLDRLSIQIVECSIMHPDSYDEPLTYHDLARYGAVHQRCHLPLVAPTQHRITPNAVEDLSGVGVYAVMIGKIAAGVTPQSWAEATRSFRRAMDLLFH
jgi:hypothetical protein